MVQAVIRRNIDVERDIMGRNYYIVCPPVVESDDSISHYTSGFKSASSHIRAEYRDREDRWDEGADVNAKRKRSNEDDFL